MRCAARRGGSLRLDVGDGRRVAVGLRRRHIRRLVPGGRALAAAALRRALARRPAVCVQQHRYTQRKHGEIHYAMTSERDAGRGTLTALVMVVVEVGARLRVVHPRRRLLRRRAIQRQRGRVRPLDGRRVARRDHTAACTASAAASTAPTVRASAHHLRMKHITLL